MHRNECLVWLGIACFATLSIGGACGCGGGGKGGSSSPGLDAGATSDGGSIPVGDGGSTSIGDGGSTAVDDSGSTPAGDGASAGGVPGGQAGPGTTISGCEIFPSDNAWNVAIDGPDVQVIHTYDSKLPQGTSLHPDFGDYTMVHYGIPYNVVDAGQPDEPTTFNQFANQSDHGPGGWVGTNPVTANASTGTTAYPFFAGMHIEGDPAAGTLKGDQHGIVLQQRATGCTSYEAWSCVVSASPPFVCANGAIFDLTSNKLRPAGWTSGDAAGLSILAGIVKFSEVQSGTVTHAIRVTFNETQLGYIPPRNSCVGLGRTRERISPDGASDPAQVERRDVELHDRLADHHGRHEEVRLDGRRHRV